MPGTRRAGLDTSFAGRYAVEEAVLSWTSRLFGARPTRPRVPEGVRVYAVGDIHGRLDLLDTLLARIDADLAGHDAEMSLQVFLGDYIDRGQASAQVIERLIRRGETHPTICLKGNHEACLLEFLENPEVLTAWSRNGGLTTLLSYGLEPVLQTDMDTRSILSAELAEVMPARHLAFLSGLPLTFTCGDFLFVHAGVRPGIPFARQREEDLLWIRDAFLCHEAAFEKIVVHGHTPVMEPQILANRINIDTGAYATGRLTCLRLEGEDIQLL
jgi:serine/threonine protein phosphatase 1